MSKQQDKKLVELHPEHETYVESDGNDSDFIPKTKPKVSVKKRTSRVKPRYDLKNKVMYEWDDKTNKFHKQPTKISKVVELKGVQNVKTIAATVPTTNAAADKRTEPIATMEVAETNKMVERPSSSNSKMVPTTNKPSLKAPQPVNPSDSTNLTTLSLATNTIEQHTKDATTQTPPVPKLSTVTTTTSLRNIREFVENEMAQIGSIGNKRKYEDEQQTQTKTTRVRAARGYERTNQAESAPNNPFGRNQRRVIKREFPYHSIVKCNGADIDEGKWWKKKDSPYFYGVVQNPRHYDYEVVGEVKEGESNVIFVMSGEYQWLDTNKPNVKQVTVSDEVLSLCYGPLEPKTENDEQDNCKKWFEKDSHGWVVKNHENPCLGCGSPWCLYKKHKTFVQQMFLRVGRCRRSSNRAKRHRCYAELIAEEYGRMGWGNRKRTGWCFETSNRVAFPDNPDGGSHYTGFRNIPQNRHRDSSCSDSSGTTDL